MTGASPGRQDRYVHSIRLWTAVFITGLVISGITAFPLVHELRWLVSLERWLVLPKLLPGLCRWIETVSGALDRTAEQYPFLAYGTDWLAFGHLVIAAAFLGLWRDPVRNRWLVTWGLLACGCVSLLAGIAGPVRGIPLYWRFIDCSFGVVGCLPLLWIRRQIDRLEQSPAEASSGSLREYR